MISCCTFRIIVVGFARGGCGLWILKWVGWVDILLLVSLFVYTLEGIGGVG